MEKQGMVSIWLGNIKTQNQLEKYADLTYDEDGESIPSKFFVDFNIDRNEIDEDFIEKEVLEEESDNISVLLEGCSYDEIILPKIREYVNLNKSYNTIILIYNFEYQNLVNSSGDFDYVTSTSYLQ
ncbi:MULTISPECIES: immunity 22 family protein [unclassified Bacillus (in: firmicutes)]|uniref:immunity 22 family protein n=1 Tax=unclassified Bacillus (in: firmicutes) TaxID=185979 RepID=UPI0008E7A9F2|nr:MULTISPECIES: immunity 22 family protein [unclassified Bacillus (in: firmicutes)]SFK09923.1 Immunity protein 22 [Bacillus sp. 71mf]SFT22377.1 Immunity protein 22 [Bacillus sp. 103mf]